MAQVPKDALETSDPYQRLLECNERAAQIFDMLNNPHISDEVRLGLMNDFLLVTKDLQEQVAFYTTPTPPAQAILSGSDVSPQPVGAQEPPPSAQYSIARWD